MTKRALRVVHLAYYYGNNTSGAPVAATRLHQALLRAGVDSHFICVEQRDSGVNVHAARRLGRLQIAFRSDCNGECHAALGFHTRHAETVA